MPSHVHDLGNMKNGKKFGEGGLVGLNTTNGSDFLTDAAGSSQSHTHNMINASSNSANNLPLYYSLSYIIRLA